MLPSNPLVEEVISRRAIHALRMIILGSMIEECESQRGWAGELGRHTKYLLLLRQVLLGSSKWA